MQDRSDNPARPGPWRRLARRALDAIAALSLLLCIASLAAWARATFTMDVARFETPTAATVIISNRWGLGVLVARGAAVDRPRPFTWTTSPSQPIEGSPDSNKSASSEMYFFGIDGFWIGEHPVAGRVKGGRTFILALIYPAVAALAAFLPARWYVLHRRRREHREAGHYIACGYDLRATPDRCPECGRAGREAEPSPPDSSP